MTEDHTGIILFFLAFMVLFGVTFGFILLNLLRK